MGQTSRPKAVGQTHGDFRVEEPKPPVNTLKAFQKASQRFGESLQALPPKYKAHVRVIYKAVRQWAAREQAAGHKVDRLSTFVYRVMEFTHQAMIKIETEDPHLLRHREEHKLLNKAFYRGSDLIDAYHAYVEDKSAK